MIYGYARISTKKQSIERQIRNIKSIYSSAIILQEAYSGRTMQRTEWQKLIKRVSKGDTIVFDSVSRMSRDADEGYQTYMELYNRGVDLIFLKEPQINTTTYKLAIEKSIPLTNTTVDYILEGINRYLMELAREQIQLAFKVSDLEVAQLRERTREGLVTAKLNGKQLGHKKGDKLLIKQSIKVKNLILTYSKDFNGTLSDVEVMKLCGCCKNTYYKYKKEIRKEL